MALTDRIVPQYAEAYRQHGRSPASLLIPKGRHYLRFGALTKAMSGGGFSVLDFGCGLGDLRPYIAAAHGRFQYAGVDVVPEFIAANNRLYGEGEFHLITDHHDVTETFDHIVCSGVFNVLYHETDAEHWEAVKEILRYLIARTKISLSFDFMTDRVDFKAEGAFHQSPIEAFLFAERELSRRVVIDQSYLPYEFAVIVVKDDTIKRPENIYRAHCGLGESRGGSI